MKGLDIKLNFQMHENQNKIFASKARFKYVKAGKQFGKSLLASYILMRWCSEKPGGLFWYLGPTQVHVRDIAWWNLTRKLVPQPDLHFTRMLEQDLYLELINGSRIYLRGAENEERLRGPKLDGVIFDEAAYIDEYVWEGIIRSQLMASGGPAFFISTPNKTGRNWFSGACDYAKRMKEQGSLDFDYFKFTSYDNPTIPKSEIDAVRSNTPDDTFALEYLAEESAFAGVIVSEFDYARHVSEEGCGGVLVRGLDWGISHPTGCLWINADEDNKEVFVNDEFMKSNLVIEESCEAIKAKTGNRNVYWSVIDPSTAKRNSQTGRRDMDEFQRHGVPCVPGDNKDRGYDIMKMFFKKGLIKIHPKCKNLIAQIRTVQYGDKTGEDMLDCLRYTLVRVHDFMFGGTINDVTTKDREEIIKERRVLSEQNPYIFPPEEPRVTQMEWLNEALREEALLE